MHSLCYETIHQLDNADHRTDKKYQDVTAASLLLIMSHFVTAYMTTGSSS